MLWREQGELQAGAARGGARAHRGRAGGRAGAELERCLSGVRAVQGSLPPRCMVLPSPACLCLTASHHLIHPLPPGRARRAARHQRHRGGDPAGERQVGGRSWVLLCRVSGSPSRCHSPPSLQAYAWRTALEAAHTLLELNARAQPLPVAAACGSLTAVISTPPISPPPCPCSSSAGPEINVRDFLPVNQTVTARWVAQPRCAANCAQDRSLHARLCTCATLTAPACSPLCSALLASLHCLALGRMAL